MSNRKVMMGFLVGTAVAALLAGMQPVKAQTANAGAAAGSNSTSTSGSASGARASSNSGGNAQSITFNSNNPADTRSTNNTNLNSNSTSRSQEGVNYTGGTTNYNRNDGDVTVRTTPTVYAPPVSGGNPCTLAVSGGVSVIGWGAAAGGTFVDQDCANRQKIAMVHNAGYAGVAKELMCNDRDTYNAFKTAGQACAWRAAFEPPGAPAQPVAPPQPIVQPLPSQPTVQPVSRVTSQPGLVQRCMDARGRVVAPGTPGASCGMVPG